MKSKATGFALLDLGILSIDTMDEYFGASAKKYGQPHDKYFSLFPALEALIPKAKNNQSVLDLGCGTGVLFPLLQDKGYSYLGTDISPDMLERAKQENPSGDFRLADAADLPKQFERTFNLVVANMLFPSIASIEQFSAVFRSAHRVLKNDGFFVVAAGHPCFDGYMQKKFFNRSTIDTTFSGYFASATNYIVHRAINGYEFSFSDYHWTLSDYYQTAQSAQFQLENFSECPLNESAPRDVAEKVARKGAPSYIVFVWRKV